MWKQEIVHAKYRFLLLVSTVFLISFLVIFLSGLTNGLSHQNISYTKAFSDKAVAAVDRGTASKVSLDQSNIKKDSVKEDSNGIIVARGKVNDQQAVVIATENSLFQAPHPNKGECFLSRELSRETGGMVGDVVEISSSLGKNPCKISGVTGDDWYSHSPVIWVAADEKADSFSFILTEDEKNITGDNTVAYEVNDLPKTMNSYQSEHKSLLLISSMLLAIGSLIVAVFFALWQSSRITIIATMKALGAKTSALLFDSLVQSVVVLSSGVAVALIGAVVLSNSIDIPYRMSVVDYVQISILLVFNGTLGALLASVILSKVKAVDALEN